MVKMLSNSYYRARIARKLNSRRGELRLRYVFAPNLKAIYLCNPKVAGQTIIHSLVSADNPTIMDQYNNLNTKEARAAISFERNPSAVWAAINDPSFFKFAFVRNPYTRCLSFYKERIFADAPLGYRVSLGLPKQGEVSFSDFLVAVSQQKPNDMNRHWRPQSELVSSSLKLDFIGKFENLVEDICSVFEKLGIEEGKLLSHKGHTSGVGTKISNDLTEREISLINDIYAKDFTRFDYEML